MRGAILVLLIGGCTFDPKSQLPNGDPLVDASAPMSSGDAPPSQQVDAPPPADVGSCTTADGALVMCLEFEDTNLTTALDGAGHHDASVTGATATTRDVPASSRALAITGGTSIVVQPSADLDLQTVTVGAWVQRGALPPSGQRFGVVDIGSRQAAITIDSAGRAVCLVRDDAHIWVGIGGTTAANEWAFVACTYDAPTLCTYVFRNGSATASKDCGDTTGDPLDTSGNTETAIGALVDTSNNLSSQLSGKLDAVRVYNRALSQTELCNSAGITGC
jgi:hypothetical protein